MFHKPVLPPVAQSEKELFRIEVSGGELPDFNEQDFFQEFCGALSLACNSPCANFYEMGLASRR